MSGTLEEQALDNEIARLEAQLQVARARRDLISQQATATTTTTTTTHPSNHPTTPNPNNDNALHPPGAPHALLLLADSALPLGSFAFSSGLESYLAHHKPLPPRTTPLLSLHHFLRLSVASLAGTTIPYIIAAYHDPSAIATWDNDLDAATACVVARRASVAQGRALLSVWERALLSSTASSPDAEAAAAALASFAARLKPRAAAANGHFAPLWGLVGLAASLSLAQTVYIFVFSHARAVLSAAVRAGVLGPYQAQAVLASAWLREEIERGVRGNWGVAVEEAGQRVPVLDLWVGRHEVLYSRIFNS